MAKKDKQQTGEQMDLIDVNPEHSKEMVGLARKYKAALAERQAALQAEIDLKQKLLALIKQEKLQPLEGDVIKFKCDGVQFSVTPRDELLKVKFDDDEE